MFKLLCLIGLFSSCVESQDITNFRIVSSIYKTRVDVAWDAVPNATRYKITGIGKIPIVQFSSRNTTTLFLSPGLSYLIMCTVQQFNNMDATLNVKLKTSFNLASNSNDFPDVTNITSIATSTSLKISWDTFFNTTLYTVVYSEGGVSDEAMLQTNHSFAEIVGLKSMTTYSVMVLVSSINGMQPIYAAQSSWYNFNTTNTTTSTTNETHTSKAIRIEQTNIVGLILFIFIMIARYYDYILYCYVN